MRSAGRCAGHCATRSKSAYFLSDFARTPGPDPPNLVIFLYFVIIVSSQTPKKEKEKKDHVRGFSVVSDDVGG